MRWSATIWICLACPLALWASDSPTPTRPTADKFDWSVVRKLMYRERKPIEALKLAIRGIKLAPDDPLLSSKISTCRFRRYAQRQGINADWEAIGAEWEKILDTLHAAYEVKPTVRRALNLIEVAENIYREDFCKEVLRQREFQSVVERIGQMDNASSLLYLKVGEFYLAVCDDYQRFLYWLDRAEDLAFKAGMNKPGELWKVCNSRVRVRIEREGYSDACIRDLQRIVRLDSYFGPFSNFALAKLGMVALTKGNIGEAEMYLALAGRAKPTPGEYDRELALALIRQGYPDVPLEYLRVVLKKQKEEFPEELLHWESLYGLGLGYLAKGDLKKATQWFEKCLDHCPTTRDGAVVRNILNEIRSKQAQHTAP